MRVIEPKGMGEGLPPFLGGVHEEEGHFRKTREIPQLHQEH
jgi:hypothetical protein